MDQIFVNVAESVSDWALNWDAVAALATLAATGTALILPWRERRRTRAVVIAAAIPAIETELDHLLGPTDFLLKAITQRIDYNTRRRVALERKPTVEEITKHGGDWRNYRLFELEMEEVPEIPLDEANQVIRVQLSTYAGLEPSLLAVQAGFAGVVISARVRLLQLIGEFSTSFESWKSEPFEDDDLEDMLSAIEEIRAIIRELLRTVHG